MSEVLLILACLTTVLSCHDSAVNNCEDTTTTYFLQHFTPQTKNTKYLLYTFESSYC